MSTTVEQWHWALDSLKRLYGSKSSSNASIYWCGRLDDDLGVAMASVNESDYQLVLQQQVSAVECAVDGFGSKHLNDVGMMHFKIIFVVATVD